MVLLEVLPEVLPVAQVALENALIHVGQVVSLIVLHHAVVHVGHRVEGLVLDNVQITVIVNVWEKPRAVVFLVVWELAEILALGIVCIHVIRLVKIQELRVTNLCKLWLDIKEEMVFGNRALLKP